ASSCSGDNEEADATPSQTTATERETTTTLDPEEAEREAVVAALEAADQAQFDSSAAPSPDPQDPAIAATHTGLMLDNWTATVEGLRRTGVAFRLPENSQYRVEVDAVNFDEVDGQRVAFLEVCTVSDVERIVVATNEVAEGGVETIQASAAMRNEQDVWKLAEFRVNTTMEGEVGCAVD
ncbi:MAG: hypothetical protein ACRD2C_07620, partial [Acidimicrobiales bacterium]